MLTDPRDGMPPAFIASSRRSFYLPSSMLRVLSSLLVAMALFLSPLAMAGGAGMAMPHAAVTAAGDHCAGTEAPSDENDPAMEVSCASSCAAYPPLSPLPAEKPAALRAKLAIAKPQLLAGIHPEDETPPPRMTPEI